MFQHILVPLDGSARAEEALPMAAHLARTSGASLTLLRIVTPSTCTSIYPGEPFIPYELERESEAYLSHVASSERLKGLKTQTQVLIGDATHILIVQFAHDWQVDLIVMRSHGTTGFMRLVMGSVAQQVMRHSTVPVLIMRDGFSPALISPGTLPHTPRLLVALDGSWQAEAALLPAAQLCATLAAPKRGAIHLTRTVQRIVVVGDESEERVEDMNRAAREEAETYLKHIERHFSSGDLASFHLIVTTSVVCHNDASDIWKRVVEESECIENVRGYSACDIIAMATHGRHGLQHLLEGSVTEGVLDGTTHPLLVVHAPKSDGGARIGTEAIYARY